MTTSRTRYVHETLCGASFFDAIADERKRFHVVGNNLGVHVGDILKLLKVLPGELSGNGETLDVRVTYVLADWGAMENHICVSIDLIEEEEESTTTADPSPEAEGHGGGDLTPRGLGAKIYREFHGENPPGRKPGPADDSHITRENPRDRDFKTDMKEREASRKKAMINTQEDLTQDPRMKKVSSLISELMNMYTYAQVFEQLQEDLEKRRAAYRYQILAWGRR